MPDLQTVFSEAVLYRAEEAIEAQATSTHIKSHREVRLELNDME